MSLARYQDLLSYALKLLERHCIYGDPHEIVEDAYFIHENPDKKHVKKAFLLRYRDAVEIIQSRKKSSTEKTRICNHCKQELPIAAFTHNGGIRHTCDNCRNAYSRDWQSKNLERHRANSLKSYHKNKHKRKKQHYDPKKYQQWRKMNPDKVKSQNAKRRQKRRKKSN